MSSHLIANSVIENQFPFLYSGYLCETLNEIVTTSNHEKHHLKLNLKKLSKQIITGLINQQN